MKDAKNCHVDRMPSTAGSLEGAAVRYLAVSGMGCPNCANRVRNALLQAEGVLEAEVDLRSAIAEVWCDEERTTREALVAAVGRAGEGSHHRYAAVPVG